ncbi:MAG: hypothetical protein AABP62_13395 [Planctomycetota bacterium]
MRLRIAARQRAVLLTIVLAVFGGGLLYWFWPRGTLPPDHGHDPGTHGGIIVSVGPEHYHVEAVFVAGELRLFTLGQDQTQIVSVPKQDLTAYVRSPQLVESVSLVLKPTPRDGDPPSETSAFAGRLPTELIGSEVIVIVPQIALGRGRYRISFQAKAGSHDDAMPTKVTNEAEKQLYLTAGGKYTPADIAANGSQTASQKYRGFKSEHDFSPKSGDRICPITRTKANPKCSWIVDSREYQFCCPPCIDEFVKRAKGQPDEIQAPDDYVKP